MFDRAKALDQSFLTRVRTGLLPDVEASVLSISGTLLADIFDTQIMSRHLDFMARRRKGESFYSIGSSGHEGMAAFAVHSRRTDIAFLHYRDAAFTIMRRKQISGSTPLWDMALSFCASADDPVSGGRHKVLGGRDICVPPQTSTIASHLPKAVGAAHSLCLGSASAPDSTIVLCSFGDASLNHSTAQGAINAASWAAYQGSPMPIVFVCEDNDIGISVPTPRGWVAASIQNRPGLKYMTCDGTDIGAALNTTRDAIEYTRMRRKPVFLHFKTVRLMGHAGADLESQYRSLHAIEDTESQDPLLKTVTYLRAHQIMSSEDVLKVYESMRERVYRVSEQAFRRPKLQTAEQIMRPVIPPSANNRYAPKINAKALVAAGCVEDGRALSLSKILNRTLAEIMCRYDRALLFGEDVGRKGGVYGLTRNLLKRFGARRVQDTLLDEQTILGLAMGCAHMGYLPIAEIQFLAYFHNAADQIRGEAATLPFFSNGQWSNPMLVRMAGLAYQRGFGGHFHNENSLTALRDIPGLIIACPSHPEEAPALLREAVRLVYEQQRVVVFIEPIALYNQMDIHTDDRKWSAPYVYPHKDMHIGFGEIGQYGDGREVAILTYGNGYYLARQAISDTRVRIIDIRWLTPLPMNAILKAVTPCQHILIVDECRRTGSISEEIICACVEAGLKANIQRITGHDSFIPLGPAAYEVLPGVMDIKKAVEGMYGD